MAILRAQWDVLGAEIHNSGAVITDQDESILEAILLLTIQEIHWMIRWTILGG